MKYRYKLLFLILCIAYIPLDAAKKKYNKPVIHDGPTLTDRKVILQLYQIMKDVHEVLTLNNIQYWVLGGTLLGAVRHQGIIPWDDDLDIGINKAQIDDFVALKPIFEKLGYVLFSWGSSYKIFSKNGAEVSFKQKDGSIIKYLFKFPFIDVFLYEYKEKIIYYPWPYTQPLCKENGVYHIHEDNLYPFKDYKFGDIIVKGPNNPIEYLNYCYGCNWQNTAHYGTNHGGTGAVKYGTLTLTSKDLIPAQPTGPLQDRVAALFKN